MPMGKTRKVNTCRGRSEIQRGFSQVEQANLEPRRGHDQANKSKLSHCGKDQGTDWPTLLADRSHRHVVAAVQERWLLAHLW